RCVINKDAGGLVDRVADGGSHRAGGGLAQSLGAEGAGGLRVFHEEGPQAGMVHKGGQLVVQQVVVQGLAALGIKEQLLRQAEADAHAHAAVDLGLRQGGVDDGAGVVDVDQIQQLYLAHGDVHLNLGKGAAEGI